MESAYTFGRKVNKKKASEKVKRIDFESVTLENFEGDKWTYSLEMLNMILLHSSTPKVERMKE